MLVGVGVDADYCDRSTNLDSWQLNQLRTMKVGGNASATEFFTKHGGSSLLTESDTKKKYTSRVAALYKEELAKRVKDDAAKYVFSQQGRLQNWNAHTGSRHV